MPRALVFIRRHRIIALRLAAAFLFGIGIISILPPFEGLDEIAHFSRFQADAFSPRSILLDDSHVRPVSLEVFNYYRKGPMPYYWIFATYNHMNDPLYNMISDNPEKDFLTYRDFFTSPPHIADYTQSYRQSPLPSGFGPTPEPNWQYQHPFLYYFFGARIIALLADHVSLIASIFILRLWSWMLAFAGLVIGLAGTGQWLKSAGNPDAEKIIAFGALYPFLMPMFFWEFARMGNDSMCLFFFGIAWAMLLWHLRAPKSRAWLYLGIALGLGWLVKALMIPTSLGIVAFLAFRAFRASPRKNMRREAWLALAKTGGLMALLGAPLYIISRIYSGSIGSLEIGDAMDGDWWGLLTHLGAYMNHIISGIVGIFSSAVWMFGTNSFIVLDLPLANHKYIYLFIILIFLSYAWTLWRRPSPLLALPLWAIAPMIAGYVFHILAIIIIGSTGLTPGYYTHVLGCAFAVIFGVGLNTLMKNRWLGMLTCIGAAALVLFNFIIVWSYMTVFGGCSLPVHNESFFVLDMAQVFQCGGRFGEILHNLEILAFPLVGLVCFACAFVMLIIGSFLTRSATRRLEA